MKYKCGYPGKDILREKAEKMMKGEHMNRIGDARKPTSAREFEKMRPFAKGGSVMTESAAMKKGGKAKSRYDMGGPVGVQAMADSLMNATRSGASALGNSALRTGRAISDVARNVPQSFAKRFAPDGFTPGMPFKKGGASKSRHSISDNFQKAAKMKMGGETTAMKKGGRTKYGMGGAIADVASGIPGIGSLFGLKDGGSAMKKGGSTKARKCAEGGEQMFAMGGVGKIRHKQASKTGMPLHPRPRGKNFC